MATFRNLKPMIFWKPCVFQIPVRIIESSLQFVVIEVGYEENGCLFTGNLGEVIEGQRNVGAAISGGNRVSFRG